MARPGAGAIPEGTTHGRGEQLSVDGVDRGDEDPVAVRDRHAVACTAVAAPVTFAREVSATPSAVQRLVPVCDDLRCCDRPPVRRGRVGPSAEALRGQVILGPEGRDMAMFDVGRVEEVHLGVGGGRRGTDGSVRFTHDRTLRRQHVLTHSSCGNPNRLAGRLISLVETRTFPGELVPPVVTR